MAEEKKVSGCLEEGCPIILENCPITIENLTMYHCSCCCDGSGNGDGNGNGNGDGNGNGNGDGNGNGNGDGNGNGNGDGNGNGNGDGNGDGGDDQIADIEIFLLGSSVGDLCHDIQAVEDGYVVMGYSHKEKISQWCKMLVATYDRSLALTSQTLYNVGSSHAFNPLFFVDEALSRYVFAPYSPVSSLVTPALVAVDSETKDVLKARRWTGGSGHTYFVSMVPTPVGFTGSSAILGIGGNGAGPENGTGDWITAHDKDLNLLKAVALRTTGKKAVLKGLLALQDKILVCGQASGNFTGGVKGGILLVMDPEMEKQAIYAYGYERDMYLSIPLKTQRGLLLAGTVVNKHNGRTDIILLEVDESYTVTRKAMLSLGSGNDTLRSLQADVSGNLLLHGNTTSVGAGGVDAFLIQMTPDFTLTKKLVFGSTGSDGLGKAIFDQDGSVVFVGGTNGAGMGGQDAFIARVSGNWEELNGSIKKFPKLSITTDFNIEMEKDFEIEVNDNTTYSLTNITGFTQGDIAVAANMDPGFIVDAGAVTD